MRSGQKARSFSRRRGEGLSANTDASGQDELSFIGTGYNLYCWDQGWWQPVDANVGGVAAAGGGFFYDVNFTGYAVGEAWFYNPNTPVVFALDAPGRQREPWVIGM